MKVHKTKNPLRLTENANLRGFFCILKLERRIKVLLTSLVQLFLNRNILFRGLLCI